MNAEKNPVYISSLIVKFQNKLPLGFVIGCFVYSQNKGSQQRGTVKSSGKIVH